MHCFNRKRIHAALTIKDCMLCSDGGKIELWDVKSATNVSSTCPHEDSVTAVKVPCSLLLPYSFCYYLVHFCHYHDHLSLGVHFTIMEFSLSFTMFMISFKVFFFIILWHGSKSTMFV